MYVSYVRFLENREFENLGIEKMLIHKFISRLVRNEFELSDFTSFAMRRLLEILALVVG